MTVGGENPYTTVYVYDANNRLLSTTKTTESGEYVTAYTYDANGAQLSRIGSTPPELLTLTTQPETEIDTYNARGQLVSAYLAGQNVVYTYRPDGLRATKTVEGETVTHVWDGANIIADVTDDTVARYVRGVNLLFAETAFVHTFYLYNAHGDVVQLTNSVGNVEHEYHYDAFGVEIGGDPTDSNPFRYCAEYFDTETGTLYLRARNYDASTGRFTSEDSFCGFMRNGLSLNLYTYCSNNPTRYSDPTGHWQEGDEKLTSAQQAAILVATEAYYVAKAAGDTGGMELANKTAIEIRNSQLVKNAAMSGMSPSVSAIITEGLNKVVAPASNQQEESARGALIRQTTYDWMTIAALLVSGESPSAVTSNPSGNGMQNFGAGTPASSGSNSSTGGWVGNALEAGNNWLLELLGPVVVLSMSLAATQYIDLILEDTIFSTGGVAGYTSYYDYLNSPISNWDVGKFGWNPNTWETVFTAFPYKFGQGFSF
jgi:RHS repeat-associated protein